MNTDTQIIILAAGKGSRMGGDIPKALTLLDSKPMIDYVVDSSLKFSVHKPIVVVGYKADMIENHLGERCFYALQAEQKGTGHAVVTARDILVDAESDIITVLFADQPFISVETLLRLSQVKQEKDARIVIATAVINDDNLFEDQFYNFGRIVRDNNNVITKIVEKKDASEAELAIREVNPAYFCLDKKWALECLAELKNDNAQAEYYLTDLVQMAFDQGLRIESIQINEREALGANTPEQLAILESFINI